MVEKIDIVKVDSVAEIKSPYADDKHVTLYFNRGVQEGTAEFERAKEVILKIIQDYNLESK